MRAWTHSGTRDARARTTYFNGPPDGQAGRANQGGYPVVGMPCVFLFVKRKIPFPKSIATGGPGKKSQHVRDAAGESRTQSTCTRAEARGCESDPRHAELGSASIFAQARFATDGWTLKPVQGDGRGASVQSQPAILWPVTIPCAAAFRSFRAARRSCRFRTAIDCDR